MYTYVLHSPVQVAQFQSVAAKLPELSLGQQCLEWGEGLEMELLEVGQLPARGEHLEEVQEDPSEVGEQAVRALESAGLSLQP